MIKKILPISVFILIFIIVLLAGIQRMMQGGGNPQGGVVITPTLFQGRQINTVTPKEGRTPGSTTPLQTPVATQLSAEEFQKKLPIVAPEFTLSYSPRMQKYVVTLPIEGNQKGYDQWIIQNPSLSSLLTQNDVIVAYQSVEELDKVLSESDKNQPSLAEKAKKDADSLMFTINSLMNLSDILKKGQVPTSIPIPTIQPQSKTPPQSSSGLTYYSQCGEPYGNYLLPIQNCTKGPATICGAGCGPTTAAMIISSYVDSTQTPPLVVEAMSKAGIRIDCTGTGPDLYNYMAKVKGIKVTTHIDYDSVTYTDADLQKDFKKYMDGGYTIFVLANFVRDGKLYGHYFWATGITEEGHILAYDPAYGQGRPAPFNESKYYPLTQYLWVFGVKKG